MTETIAEDLVIENPTAETGSVEAPQEEVDVTRIPQRRPPSRGLCRRCNENKPINRLMLCYPCWVKTQLEKSGWKDGEPHPDWCECVGSSAHQRRSDGN